MGVLVEPGIVVDQSVEGEEGGVIQVFEGVVGERWLKGVVGIYHSLDSYQFGILDGGGSTEWYLTQEAVLLIST